MKYRVWWMPNVEVGATFYIPVESPQDGKVVMDLLAAYDKFQYDHNITPDYCHSGGFEMYDKEIKDWIDWYYEDDDSFYDDLDEYIANRSPDADALESFTNAIFSQIKFDNDEDDVKMTEKIREQIMAIRDSGETNMLDTRTVQRIANREGYYGLVVFLEEHPKEYWNFIMTGEETDTDDDE